MGVPTIGHPRPGDDNPVSGREKTKEASGTVVTRQRSLNIPGSALLKEKQVVVSSSGSSVPLVWWNNHAQPQEEGIQQATGSNRKRHTKEIDTSALRIPAMS